METENIIASNKLIAEFMGAVTHKTAPGIILPYIKSDEVWYGNNTIPNEQRESAFKISELKYHSSWDWLMPVVKKIGKMYEDLVKNAYETKTPISYEIHSTYADVICRNVTIEVGYLFEIVVEFIKWYNLCQREK